MVNKVILVGNLGKDPEVKQFESGSVANFSLATNEVYNDKNGVRQTVTEWHNVSVWGKLAEIAQKFLKKGSKIYLEGKITTRKYQDKDGADRYITEIRAENFKMLDPRSEGGEGTYSPPLQNTEGSTNQAAEPDDDLPF